jgi:ornithine carbamoyltransferase
LQKTVDGLAHWSKVPVINALSDMYHPCQALADMQTLQEHFGDTRGLKLAFVGDGNNVAHSLMLNAARLGMDFALATPTKYEAEPGYHRGGRGLAARLRLGTHRHERSGRSRTRRARDLYRRVGQHGRRKKKPPSAARVRGLSG